jgi:hypothetical protein
MENVCILYAIGNILWPLFYILLAFGIVYGYLVHFFRFGMLHHDKYGDPDANPMGASKK